MYEDVLHPTDGSHPADVAAGHAIDLARTYGATLHVLNVVDPPTVKGTQALEDKLVERGEQIVRRVGKRARREGVERVEAAVFRGPPHRGILSYVENHGVDVVVMGTHGRSGLDKFLLGSVTQKVVRLADVPVLTVHESNVVEPPDD